MTEYKIQHFIPQWYLRNFSFDPNNDGKNEHIWIYDVHSKNIDPNTIHETAQKEYFYGKDGEFEKSLMNIENETAKAVNVIIKNENIKNISESTRKNIYKFILLQSHRTDSSKVITENFVKNYVDDKIKPQLRIKYEEKQEFLPFIESLELDDADFFQYMMKIALADIDIISDLKLILLINSTTIPFITSDYPVVMNNYYYKKMGLHGLQTPGLQIICPINDKICLLLVHEELYKITVDKLLKIKVSQNTDVNSINYLQILNCYKQVFSKTNKLEYIRQIHADILKIREEIKFPRNKREYDDIIERNYGIRFSFLKNNPKCGAIISEYTKSFHEAKERLPFRNKYLLDKARAQSDSVIASNVEEYRSKLELKIQ